MGQKVVGKTGNVGGRTTEAEERMRELVQQSQSGRNDMIPRNSRPRNKSQNDSPIRMRGNTYGTETVNVTLNGGGGCSHSPRA